MKAGIRGKEEGNLKDFAKEGAAGSRERGEKIFSILSLLFSFLLLFICPLSRFRFSRSRLVRINLNSY